MIKVGNINIEELYVGSKPIDKAYVGTQLIYERTSYYGIAHTLNQSDPNRTRIGKMEYHRTLPLLSLMKGCTIDNNGNIKYLDPNNWAKYEDGTNRDYELNTMVEIPEFWALTVVDGTNIELRLYMKEVPNAEHFSKLYCSAYEATKVDTALKSVNLNDLKPTVSANRQNMQAWARINGNNWNMYTYKVHKAITLLYMVEYASTYSQANVNNTLTADGYKQGGIGSGPTGGIITINGVNTYSVINCGVTDSIGNESGEVAVSLTNTDAEGNATSTIRKANRYRGIENPFGHVWKNVIDIIVHYNAETNVNDVYTTEDPTKFGNDITNYEYLCSTVIVNGWYKDLQYTPRLELFVAPDALTGGGTTTYITDHQWTSDSATDRTLIIGGAVDSSGLCGLFALGSINGLSSSSSNVGTRIIYIP